MRVAIGILAMLFACAGPGPILDHHVHVVKDGALTKVAVVPFYPLPQLSKNPGPKSVGAIEAADIVARIVSEAFAGAGIDTVPPSDLVIGFEGQGDVLPRQDVNANAALAADKFGATSILLGKVGRYREREGGAAGALAPASVYFEVELYSAPGGVLLYSARFDETQIALSENLLVARRYPGAGTRWLSAAELARWGADHMVSTLPEVQR